MKSEYEGKAQGTLSGGGARIFEESTSSLAQQQTIIGIFSDLLVMTALLCACLINTSSMAAAQL